MKVALFGYGKMGQLIERLAISRGHTIVARYSKTSFPSLTHLQEADVCIDFSHAEAVVENVKLCIIQNKPLIIGTTGWNQHLSSVEALVKSSSIGCLHAPNFSIGVYLFTQMISYAAKLMSSFDSYDISGVEYHHRHKADSPSGTAKLLANQITKEMNLSQPIDFVSVRCGHMPGTHTIHFDGPIDTITLTHQARNREGFADGALQAAEWILGKKGFFTLEDFLVNQKINTPFTAR